MRLYRAICQFLEAKAHMYRQPEPESPREVDMSPSAVEHSGLHQREELDQDAHRSEDWSEDPDQVRRPRIGFTSPRHEMKEGPAPDPYGWPAHPQVREAHRRISDD